MPNAVCKFYAQGRCNYGANCRFDHPRNLTQNQDQNRVQGNGFGTRNDSQRAPQSGRNYQSRNYPFHISIDHIETDLKDDRPIWILSSYGPGRDAPRQMFGDYPLDQSFEEMRVKYYLGMASGNVQPAIHLEQELLNKAEQQISTVLNNLPAAAQYVVDGEKQHPNRVDMCREFTGKSSVQPPSQASINQTSSFGQPSVLGTPQTQSAFAQQNPPQQSSFGKPSAFAQPSAFGRPSALGGQPSALGGQPSAFGQPSPMGAQPSAFGRPSSLSGQPSAFGQPSALGSQIPTSNFGTPSTFGQNSLQNTSFTQPQQSSQPAPFAPPQNTVKGPFAQTQSSGFPVASSTSAFGQPSGLQNSSPFNQSTNSATASPFMQTPSTGSTSAFGQPSSLGVPAANLGPFRGVSGGQSASPFTSTAPRNNPELMMNGGVQTNSSNNAYSTRGPDGKTLQTWKGQPVQYMSPSEAYYRPVGSQNIERIWHPDGPPILNKWAEAPPEKYTPEIKAAYDFLKEKGTFKDGVIPEIAPSKDMVRWDL